MSPEPEPPVGLTGRSPDETFGTRARGADGTRKGPDGQVPSVARGRRGGESPLLRLTLLLLSTAGVLTAAGLWMSGQGGLGLRLLAGDVLLIAVVVLLL